MHNIQQFMSIILHHPYHTYWTDVNLHIVGGTLLSEEGAAQGDLLALPMYALGVVPLINTLMILLSRFGMLMMLLHVDV